MRILMGLLFALAVAGCAEPMPARESATPISSPIPIMPSAEEVRKLGPSLRQHLMQQSRRVLRSPDKLGQELRPITVVIRADRDISPELNKHGVKIRSITGRGPVIITADVLPTAIPDLLKLPDLQTIELSQPIPPAKEDG